MASTHLTRTFGSATTQQTWTMSFWVKRGKLGVSQFIAFCTGANSNNNWLQVGFNNDDRFILSGYSTAWLKTTRLFRDPSAWYHIVVQADSPQSTASNRLKVYVNGVEETSFETDNRSSITQSQTWGWNRSDGYVHYIGSEAGSGYFDGYLSHFHFSDGSIIAPTVFGSTDSTTGEWKINPDASFTLGNNGFTILKDGNTVTDQSTNSNDFSVAAGTLTKSEDCPSNVFCTWNPVYRSTRKDMTLTNGNTFVYEQNSGDSAVSGTIAVSSGKWYWEQKAAQVTGTNFVVIGGLHTVEDFNETPTSLNQNNTVGMRDTGNVFKGTSDLGNFTSAVYNGDVFGIGFDADNGSMYFWRNGSALNSGNAIVTGLDMTKTWTPFAVQHGGARVSTSTNFGNGYFQTTAVSSAGTNSSGNGIFEYDVPSGYTALSTKGLNL